MSKKDIGCIELLEMIGKHEKLLQCEGDWSFKFDCSGDYASFDVFTEYSCQPPLEILNKIKEIFKADDVRFVDDNNLGTFFNIKISSWFK